jgi:putative transposase
MRKGELRGWMRGRRRKGTTRRAGRAAPAEDLVKRKFAATQADRVWAADSTCVATGEGFLYMAVILDVYSRRIVGWAMQSHLRSELVVDASRMAVCRRNPAPGLVHHSDQGAQGGFNRSRQHRGLVAMLAGHWVDSTGRSNTPEYGGVQWEDRRVGVRR